MFFWDPATDLMEDLGTLGGPNSSGMDINEAGQIAGTSDAPLIDAFTTRAFFWSPDTRELQMIEPLFLFTDPEFGLDYAYGFGSSNAVAINNAGLVAGVWDGAPAGYVVSSAFVWNPQNGQRSPHSLLAYADTVDINDSGQVLVGVSSRERVRGIPLEYGR